MEIEKEENKMEIDEENNDITAKQLYEKFESWNNDVTKSFIDPKKEKKNKKDKRLIG